MILTYIFFYVSIINGWIRRRLTRKPTSFTTSTSGRYTSHHGWEASSHAGEPFNHD